MHNGRTSKIVEHIAKSAHHKAIGSIVAEPATAPCPVTLDGVDEQRNNGTVNHIHRELGALSHSTTDDSGRSSTENGLENEETLYGQIAFVETQVAPVGHTNESSTFTSKHKAEAKEEEQE